MMVEIIVGLVVLVAIFVFIKKRKSNSTNSTTPVVRERPPGRDTNKPH